ncbi:hypothetical protein [Stenotrophomonas sp.]|uniref:hypothetical protein n=1 Tax=Stenotrophomonas sp. TaxID=69392 RepID=UPI002FC5EEE0
MSIYADLLFLQGHITNAALARQLAAPAEAAGPAIAPLPDNGTVAATPPEAAPTATIASRPCRTA